MVEIIIRDYCPGDLAALIDLFRGSVRSVARRDYSERQVLAWAPDFIDSEGFALRCTAKPTWVAEINRQIVGFADLEPDGHVDMLFVHAEHQAKGIARALLDISRMWQCAAVLIGFTPKRALPRAQHLNTGGSRLSLNKLLQAR
jgi:GNAT superfamily N-acetyltransferase